MFIARGCQFDVFLPSEAAGASEYIALLRSALILPASGAINISPLCGSRQFGLPRELTAEPTCLRRWD